MSTQALLAYDAAAAAPISSQDLQEYLQEQRLRYADRDRLGNRLRDALINKFDISFKDILGPNEEPVVSNLAWSGVRIYAQRLGRMPRITCKPTLRQAQPTSVEAIKRAENHERALRDYLEQDYFPATLESAAFWLVAHDLAVFTVRPDETRRIPVIQVRDPLGTYPGSALPHRPSLADCIFVSRMSTRAARRLWSLPENFQKTKELEIVEYWDSAGLTIAVSGGITERQSFEVPSSTSTSALLHIVEFAPSYVPGEPCVFIGRGPSPDGDFHGQFDHMVPAMIMRAKIRALEMRNIHELVYPHFDIFAAEGFEFLSGDGKSYATGPGATNILKNGTSQLMLQHESPQVFQHGAQLAAEIREGTQFPQQLSGQPVSSVSTGKGTEALLTGVDDNTASLQRILARPLQAALSYMPKLAKAMKADGYDRFTDTVDTFVRFHTSSDPGQTIRHMQLSDKGWLPDEYAMDEMYEIEDRVEAKALVQAKRAEDVLFQSIIARYTSPDPATGAPPDPMVLARFTELVRKGEFIEKAYAHAQPGPATTPLEALQATQMPAAPSLDQLLAGSNTTTLAQSQAQVPGGAGFIGAQTRTGG